MAGFFMPTETQAATAVETPAQEWSRFTDESLNEVFGDAPETAKETITPEPAKTEPPKTEATAEVKEEVKAEQPKDEALASLDALIAKDTPETVTETETPKVSTPQSPELQTIESWTKDPQLAKEAVSYASQGHALNEAFRSGDMARVEAQFDKSAWKHIVNHVWETHKDELIQRAVDEQNGVKYDPRTELLERQLQELTTKLTAREQRELQDKQLQEQSRQAQDRTTRFNQTWTELFNAVKVSDPTDQKFLRGAVMETLAADPKKIAQVSQGNFKDVRLAFREVYQTWHTFRKQADLAQAETREKQESKQSGKLVNTSAGDGEQPVDYDEDGRRTKSFWQRSLASIGLDK